MEQVLTSKNSSAQNYVASRHSVQDTTLGQCLGASSEVPAASFYGKYQYNIPECLPSSAPQQYLHIYPLPTLDSDFFFTEAQPCDGIEDVTVVPSIEDPGPEEEPNDIPVEEDNDAIKDVAADGDRLDASLNEGDRNLCDGPTPDASSHGNSLPLLDKPSVTVRDGQERQAPTQVQVIEALKDLKNILRPPRKTGAGYTDPNIDPFARIRMEAMQTMLHFYTNPKSNTYDKWGASACQAAISLGRGEYCARQLTRLSRQFIRDRAILPLNPYGKWNESLLVDEDLAMDINLHLQELGKEISAKKVVEFLGRADVKEKHGITKNISESTARRYLKTLGYRFMAPKKGQYADGHERDDVVWYRNHKFLPAWREIQDQMYSWTKDNIPEVNHVDGKRVVVWFHDESIFYAHDRRKKGWYHKDAPAKPYTKGEGASLMVADFVSADFGWLQSPDGTKNARRVMKPGKNRDGYFTSEDI
jgi:hypothetical protein